MNFGRYQILKELGKGAMGVVYQAHDPEIDRMVALKVLREDRVSSDYFVQRFFKEAKAIGRLSHPNIVTVYDVGKDHDTIYIAMEFLDGKPLDEVIGDRKLDLEEVVNIGIPLAEALGYAHQKGIVHRDIKPTNIILTSDKQVKITDFGIARIEDSSMAQQTQAGEILGTPFYMPPEQIMGQAVDGRSDLYSLGVFLYKITTGQKPFEGKTLAVIFKSITQDTPAPPHTLDPAISKWLSDLVMKSLSKDPKDRFQTGKEMAQALAACLEKEKKKEVHKLSSGKTGTRNIGMMVVVALLLLSCAGGFAYYFMSKERPVAQPADQTERLIPDSSVKRGEPSDAAIPTKEKVTLLNIESIPTSAKVYVDGDLKGNTPLKYEIPIGKHEVRLNLERYYPWEAQLKLDKEGETPLFVRLVPKDE